jgi:hypothetical protein
MNCTNTYELGTSVGYIFFYDLAATLHQTLIQKFQFGKIYKMFSIKMTYVGDSGFIFAMTDSKVTALQITEFMIASIPPNQLNRFEKYDNLTFIIRPEGQWLGTFQMVNVTLVHTGFMLKTLDEIIKVPVAVR